VLRYLAVTWSGSDPRQAAAAARVTRACEAQRQWRCALERDGIRVFHASVDRVSGDCHVLPEGSGIILGAIFERSAEADTTSRFAARFDALAVERITRSGGRALIDSYWGAYVAFVADRFVDRKWVLRGPMADLPVLMTTLDGAQLFCSSVADCVALGLRFSINLPYVQAHLVLSGSRARETGLNEVTSLEIGECLEVTNGVARRRYYWHPCDIARRDPVENPQEAARLLRRTTRACVHGWASRHLGILHRLSGGLDSSIVLSCLADAPTRPDVTCLHYHSPDGRGDERTFARAAASRAHCELIELERNRTADLSRICTIPLTASPLRDLCDFDRYRTEAALAHKHGASAIFCGALGDGLFHFAPALPAVAEYIRRHGIGPELLEVIMDVVRLGEVSVWKALQSGLRDGVFRSTRSYWLAQLHQARPDARLVSRETFEEFSRNAARFIHPWFETIDDVPLGKLGLINALTADNDYDMPYATAGDAPVIGPLVAQPLAEVCLRIPTHLNVRDGRDRSVARRAFANDIPDMIIRRTTKGTPADWLKHVIARNSAFVREFLLDGILVAEGLLDRALLESAMPGSPGKTTASGGLIMQHLYTEAWMRKWRDAAIAAAHPSEHTAALYAGRDLAGR
jgi:asparagine synthase (glutamine-hydrolysing)